MSILDRDSEEIYKALHLLARKVNPNYNFSTDQHWIYIDNKSNIICLICKKVLSSLYSKIDEHDSSFSIEDQHGLEHLKEYKLLAFI